MRLLLVEDDEMLGGAVRAGIAQEGYAVDWLRDGRAACRALESDHFDLIVLDLGLPGCSGLEVLQHARGQGVTTPTLILTAWDAVSDRVSGLDAGADDYLTKPFDLEELAARLRALGRRGGGRAEGTLRHGPVELDPAARTVHCAGKAIDLSGKEFALLQMLLQNAGRVMARERLEDGLYGWAVEVESNTVEVHVHHLRRKLGRDLIRTVRGVGYTVPREEA
ncbi:MAG TPA: response regulator [Gammaproteobacteria bacterium]|nr:response regulator [Gammaproteobacteria bacterium]